MKTAVIWLDPAEGTIVYYVIDADWRRFHDIFINFSEDSQALSDAMYNDVYVEKHTSVTIDIFRQAIADGAFLIECGFCS